MGSISDPVEDELLVQGGMQLPEPQEPIFMGKAVLKRPPRDRLR
jgi:hypothetical protein